MKKIIAASVLSLAALSAHAAEQGAYLFGNLGYNFAKPKKLDTQGVEGLSASHSAAGASWELGGGYRFNDHFALEASYADFGKAKTSVAAHTDDINGNVGVSLEATALRLAAVGILPVTSELELFGKVTLNQMYFNASANASASIPALGFETAGSGSEKQNRLRPGIGLGAAYKINKQLSLRGEYEYVSLPNWTLPNGASVMQNGMHIVKAGISYRF
ncbi:outer membrane protein [Chromobacterium violaceum]|uniref:outer membrane protein n=1 Tax=Chromobacterium violaceum TaxID=536 RepID=UPI003DA7FA52